jgi:hypothetical protein
MIVKVRTAKILSGLSQEKIIAWSWLQFSVLAYRKRQEADGKWQKGRVFAPLPVCRLATSKGQGKGRNPLPIDYLLPSAFPSS